MKLPILLTSLFLGSGLLSQTPVRREQVSDRIQKKNCNGSGEILPVVLSTCIDKSDDELNVYDDKGWFATYPVYLETIALVIKKWKATGAHPRGIFIS